MKNKCEICGSKKYRVLFKQNFKDTSIFLFNSYRVVQCLNCNFIYAIDIPNQKLFDEYYEKLSQYEFIETEGIVLNSYSIHNEKIINFISSDIKLNFEILEIGCSTGNLLSLLKKRGYINLCGVDPSEKCISYIKKLYNITAIKSNINNLKINKKFDLIILSSVLEHLVDLKKSFKKICSLLKDKGLIFIEVPDVERFKDFIFFPYQQFSGEHIRYFSKNSLEQFLNLFNLKTIKFEKNINMINKTIDPNLFFLVQKNNENSLTKIQQYIIKSNVLKKELEKNLKLKLKNIKEVIVWSVGTPTHTFLNTILKYTKVLYFVDSNINYKSKKIKNIIIKQPIEIKENIPILITSFSHNEEIISQIKTLNLKNKIINFYE